MQGESVHIYQIPKPEFRAYNTAGG